MRTVQFPQTFLLPFSFILLSFPQVPNAAGFWWRRLVLILTCSVVRNFQKTEREFKPLTLGLFCPFNSLVNGNPPQVSQRLELGWIEYRLLFSCVPNSKNCIKFQNSCFFLIPTFSWQPSRAYFYGNEIGVWSTLVSKLGLILVLCFDFWVLMR